MANTTDPAMPGSPDTSATTTDPAAQPAKPVPVYTKDDLTAKIKRETSPLLEKVAAYEAKLAEIEAEKAKAEEAKLSATQRVELERKRETETWTAKLRDAETRAASERSRRHDAIKRSAATKLVAKVSQRLVNPEIADDLIELAHSALVIEDDGKGGERVAIRLGAELDTEPLDAGEPKFIDARLARYFKAEGGAGARHGQGGGGFNRNQMQALSPIDRMEAALGGKR